MPFDPDQYLAEDTGESQAPDNSPPPEAPSNPSNDVGEGGMPAQVQPPNQGFDPDKYLEPENQAQYGTASQMAKTFGEGVGRGLITQPGMTLAERASGVPAADILGREKANPWTNFAGELTGFVGGALTGSGEAALLEKAGSSLTGYLGASKLGGLAIKGLIDAEALTGGDEVNKMILQDPNQTAGSAVAHMGLSAVLGPIIGTVPALWSAGKGGAVKGILSVIKADSEGLGASLTKSPGDMEINNFMKNVISAGLGPSTENIDAKIANNVNIRMAPEFQDVYDHLLDHISEVGDNSEKQNAILDDAMAEFKERGIESRYANTDAKMALRDVQNQIITDNTNAAYSKANVIPNAVSDLRDSVVAASQGGYDLLDNPENANKMVSLKPMYDEGRRLADEIYAGGFTQDKALAETIRKDMDSMGEQYGNQISGSNAKMVIQALDQKAKFNSNAANFGNGLAPVYGQLRHVLNETLVDTIKPYGEYMKPVEQATKVLGRLYPYGTPGTALSKIKGLATDINYIRDMPDLDYLEKNTQVKFTQDLKNYADPKLIEARMKSLPQWKEAQRASTALRYFSDPRNRASMASSIMSDPEWIRAFREKDILKGLTENTLQGKMNAVMGGKNIAARTLLEKLPPFQGMSIPEILDLISVREAFQKGAGMGSKYTNLFGAAGATGGGFIGGALGGVPGAAIGAGIGAPIGGMFGAGVDKKGPQIAAKLLDRYVAAYGPLSKEAGLGEKATNWALRTILGKSQTPSAEGFKAAGDYTANAAKGFFDTKKAAKAVFEKGSSVLPSHLIPKQEDIDKLDGKLKDIQQRPHQMYAFGGHVAHYMPEHAEALAKIGSAAVGSLNSIRPYHARMAPLDEEIEPSQSEKSDFHDTLGVAQQPLMLLHHIKNSTLLPQHVAIAKQIYPHFYDKIGEELTKAMTDHISEGGTIPYNVKQGLSLFHGQPMDSTMSQPSILAAQMSFQPQNQMPPNQPVTKNKKNTSKLGEASGQYRTSDQAAQARQSQSKV